MKMTDARELAFKLLYSMEMQKENSEEQINLFFEMNNIEDDDIKKYIIEINTGISKEQESICNLIKKNLKESWSIERVSKIDLSILKLGIYEMLFRDVPYKVAINESVELAKKYGEETSGNFVNGIFASIVKEKNIS